MTTGTTTTADGADRGPDPDGALLGFEEFVGGIPPLAGCGCPACAARPRTARPAATGGAGRIHRAVRNTCLATTVLAGAGAVGLTAGAGAAHAAPGKQGWDGSRYWFKNAKGEWRYTAHRDVYLARTGQSGGGATKPAASAATASTATSTATATSAPAPAAGSSGASSGGMKQGWDGSRYWFRNAKGEWRYTAHRDVYLARTGQSGGGATKPAVHSPSFSSEKAAAPSAGRTETAVQFALAQLGKPYVWGGDGPDGYDCSGLVQQAFRRSGIELPRVADDQYAATTPITKGQLRRGDLVFWSDSGRASGIHHVAVYLGGNRFVEAPRPGRPVRISTISSGFHPTHYGRP
ncbi:C40 family peptidase [Kitasatospora sp. NPDC054939]